jgi:fucose permease
MAAGMLLMNAGSFAICLAGFTVNGIGVGLTLPAINMLVLEMNPLRAASALNILNFCWGAGAIVCKPFVDFAGRGQIAAPTIALAIVLLIFAVFMFRLPAGSESTHAATLTDKEGVPIWTTTLAWVLTLFNFVHVGFESGVGGWLTTYTERIEGEAKIVLISPTFLYFLFFVAGRGVAPVFFRYLSENVMLLVSLVLVLAGMVVTLTAEDVVQLSIGASISGFGTSSIFPTTVSRFGRVFGPSATRKATPLFICGTLGAATVTWLIGFLSNKMSDLRSGMYVLAASVVILLVLQVGLMLRGVRDPGAIASES